MSAPAKSNALRSLHVPGTPLVLPNAGTRGRRACDRPWINNAAVIGPIALVRDLDPNEASSVTVAAIRPQRFCALVLSLAAVATALGWSLLRLNVFTKPVLPTDLAPNLDRAATALVLGVACMAAYQLSQPPDSALAAVTANPLLELHRTHCGDAAHRDEAIASYALAVPTEEAIDLIAVESDGAIVELGARTGYWAKLLSDRCVDVVAYDIDPPPSATNR